MMIRTSLIAFMIGAGLFWLAQLEPSRVTISGDDIVPMRIERRLEPSMLRSASSLPNSTSATAVTGPYMQTVATPCIATTSATSGGICYTSIPVSR